MAILIWVLAIHPSVLHRLVCLKLKLCSDWPITV